MQILSQTRFPVPQGGASLEALLWLHCFFHCGMLTFWELGCCRISEEKILEAHNGFGYWRMINNTSGRLTGVLIVVVTGCMGCATVRPFNLMQEKEVSGLHVLDFQHISQKKPYDCGEGAMAIVFTYWKHPVTPEAIMQDIFDTTPASGGTTAADLKAYAERKGFRAFLLHSSREDICRQLDKGRPMIICRRKFGGVNHYEVAVGYNEKTQRMIVANPAGSPYSVSNKCFDRWRKRVDDFALLAAPEAP